MKKFTILGERCSGTNYLEEVILLNFDVEICWNFAWKHYFNLKNDFSNNDDVLFIGIIRNLEDWINSLYREKHHLPNDLTINIDTYLNNTFYSIDNKNNELMCDRNMETGERYKNIFELRRIKNKFLIEIIPTLVKNYCLITYEELTTDFHNIMNKIKNYGLEVKNHIEFPLNITYYKKNKDIPFIKKVNIIPKNKIFEIAMNDNELIYYEILLYSKNKDNMESIIDMINSKKTCCKKFIKKLLKMIK